METLLIFIGVIIGMVTLLFVLKFMVSPDPRLIQISDTEFRYKGYTIKKCYVYKDTESAGRFDLDIKKGKSVKFISYAFMFEATEWIDSRSLYRRIRKFFWS